MKRMIPFLFSILLTLLLVACTQPQSETQAVPAQAEAHFTETPAAVTIELTPVATEEPTAVPTPEPTDTPEPTPTPTQTPTPTPEPTPTPTPEPTATPEPVVAFADEFTIVTAARKTTLNLKAPNYKDLPKEYHAEVRLEDGTVVGSATLKAARNSKIDITIPEGSPVRTSLYLYLEGTSYPIHSYDIAVVDKTYEPVRGNYERNDKMVAFTFDCAYGEKNTDWLLDTLKQYNAHATFFMTGGWVGNHGPWIRRMIEEGHELGSHSISHPRLTEKSVNTAVKEIKGASDRIYELYGYRVHLFRPPYGSTNATINSISRFFGQEVIMWGQTAKDASGWEGERIIELLKKEVVPGKIILCHNAAPELKVFLVPTLEWMSKEGYTFGTVSELMGWTWDDTFAPGTEPAYLLEQQAAADAEPVELAEEVDPDTTETEESESAPADGAEQTTP